MEYMESQMQSQYDAADDASKILELKHLRGYAGHGVKAHAPINNTWWTIRCAGLDWIYIINDETKGTWYENYSFFQEHYNIYLHPLDRLTQQITIDGYNDGKPFVPADEFFIMYGGGVPDATTDKWKNDFVDNMLYSPNVALPYGQIIQLHQWHFDTGGLIEKGIALPINTP